MPTRTRALALSHHADAPAWLGWTGLALATTLALAGSLSAAHGQAAGPTASDAAPPASSPSAPAEIQPGHTAGTNPAVVAPSTGSSGPQTAAPAPLPPGSGADTPGGSARSGVIRPPPSVGDPDLNKGAPTTGTMPVIPPPGAPGGSGAVVPK